MNSCELTFGITSLANTIACRLSDEDLELAGAFFTQLGDTLTTISVHRSICGKNADSDTTINSK